MREKTTSTRDRGRMEKCTGQGKANGTIKRGRLFRHISVNT